MKINFIQNDLLFEYSKNLRDKELFKLFNISRGKEKEYLKIKRIEYKNHIVKGKALDNKNIIKLVYKIDEKNKETKILKKKFVITNKNRTKIIINNKQYNLVEKIKNEKVKIKFIVKIKFLENIIDIDCMFKGCKKLCSVKNFSKINTKNLRNKFFILWMFFITKNR